LTPQEKAWMLHHYQKMAELGLPHVMKSDVPDYGVVRFFFILQLWQKMHEFSNQVLCTFNYVAFHIYLAEGQCIDPQGCRGSGSTIFSFFLSFSTQ
jgi:hypothetical protein